MEEKDFQRIEQLIGKAVKAEVGKAVKAEVGKAVKAEVGKAVKAEVGKAVKAEIGGITDEIRAVRSDVGSLKEEMSAVRSDVENLKTEITAVRSDVGNFKEEIKEDFRLQVGILSEDFHGKLQLVAEGHQMLAEKMDRMHGELGGKIDAVAVDLAAHRVDTEGHKRGYMVQEP